MKNCFDCKHKVGRYTDLLSSTEKKTMNLDEFMTLRQSTSTSGDYIAKCNAGNNEELREFYNANHHKTWPQLEQENAVLPCHEYPEGIKMLDSMSSTLDKMLALVKENTDPI